jgi:hypothetical protein
MNINPDISKHITQHAQEVLKTANSLSASVKDHIEYLSDTINQPDTLVQYHGNDGPQISIFYNPDFNKKFGNFTNPVLTIVKTTGYDTFVATIVEASSITNLSLGGHAIAFHNGVPTINPSVAPFRPVGTAEEESLNAVLARSANGNLDDVVFNVVTE